MVNSDCTDSTCLKYWKKQKINDSINELKINKIIDKVINNFFDLYHVYDNNSSAYTDLYIYLGHYSQESLLKYKDKIIQSAEKGLITWDLAFGLETQLIFKFPCDISRHKMTNYLYDLKIKNHRLDVKASYLTLSAMASFLNDNKQYKVSLVYFDGRTNNIIILNDIKKALMDLKTEPQRISILEKKYEFSKPSSQPKSNFGWQRTW